MRSRDERRTEHRWVRLQDEPLDVGAASDFLADERAGALDLFVGITRRWTEGRETSELMYEAYRPMALAELDRLADEAEARWPIVRACLVHRLGRVPLGEASVIVGVATPHRSDAFAACRFLIDRLKRQVPIWKREVYADGRTEWVQGTAPPDLRRG